MFFAADVSISPVMQNGTNAFAKLESDPFLTKRNVNGVSLIWDTAHDIVYARFTDTNPVYADAADGTDSILTVAYEKYGAKEPSNDFDQSDKGQRDWALNARTKFAQQAIDQINTGRIWNTAAWCGEQRCEHESPILVDDRGRAVPNPIVVLVVYYLLAYKNYIGGIDSFGFTDPAAWRATQQPFLRAPATVEKIAQSMTVHPNCDGRCTYPGFVVTGWNSPIARADGRKLGVDPAKVPNPTFGHRPPVFPSIFPDCMCDWRGTRVEEVGD